MHCPEEPMAVAGSSCSLTSTAPPAPRGHGSAQHAIWMGSPPCSAASPGTATRAACAPRGRAVSLCVHAARRRPTSMLTPTPRLPPRRAHASRDPRPHRTSTPMRRTSLRSPLWRPTSPRQPRTLRCPPVRRRRLPRSNAAERRSYLSYTRELCNARGAGRAFPRRLRILRFDFCM